MPKYQVAVTLSCHFIFDTDDFEDDFAKTKDELVDKLDPNDEGAVHDFIVDLDTEHFNDEGISVDQVSVKPVK